MKDEKKIGVIGGIGPLSTSYFMDLVILNTEASCDQDHINMIVLNHATIPDRTAYILDNSKENPLIKMIEDAKLLESLGCDFLVMPCNTAHYFYDEIVKNINVPFLNIIKVTIERILAKNKDIEKIGIMATEGTIKAETYQNELVKHNIESFIPSADIQKEISSFIYDYVKKGKHAPLNRFERVLNYFYDNHCSFIIIGCTELSVIVKDYNIKDDRVVDSLESLALKTIELSLKKFR